MLKLEQALRHQIRHEYNKTGRHSNVTNIEVDHVTIVLDLIQVKVTLCVDAIQCKFSKDDSLGVARGRRCTPTVTILLSFRVLILLLHTFCIKIGKKWLSPSPDPTPFSIPNLTSRSAIADKPGAYPEGGSGGPWPPPQSSIEWIFYGEKLALLGRTSSYLQQSLVVSRYNY